MQRFKAVASPERRPSLLSPQVGFIVCTVSNAVHAAIFHPETSLSPQQCLGRLQPQCQRHAAVVHHSAQKSTRIFIRTNQRSVVRYCVRGGRRGSNMHRRRCHRCNRANPRQSRGRNTTHRHGNHCGLPVVWLDADQTAEQFSLGVFTGWEVE